MPVKHNQRRAAPVTSVPKIAFGTWYGDMAVTHIWV